VKLGVVVPCYRQERFLPRTIEWRDRTGTVAVISVALVEQLAPDALPAGVLPDLVPRHRFFAQILHFAYTIRRLADLRTVLSGAPGGPPRRFRRR